LYLILGSLFDMRGKRFLDATIIPSQEGIDQNSQSNLSSPHSTWTNSFSWYSSGNGKKNSSFSSPDLRNGNSISPTPVISDQQRNAIQYGVLFVQDPSLVLLISQDKREQKIAFQVFCVAPLLQSCINK
jgi:hypothetical protein